MTLLEILEKKKKQITDKWFEATAQTYPEDAVRFIKTQKNRFDNPVGMLTKSSLEGVFSVILKNDTPETIQSILDPVIRIRAIQSFSPQKSVSFIYLLKKVIRHLLKNELNSIDMLKQLNEFEMRIDELALIALDLYVICREKIFEIKATEEKKRTFSAFERAGLIREIPEEGITISEKMI